MKSKVFLAFLPHYDSDGVALCLCSLVRWVFRLLLLLGVVGMSRIRDFSMIACAIHARMVGAIG